MIGRDFLALTPLIVLGGGAVMLLLAIAARRSYRLTCWLTAAVFVAALALTGPAASAAPRHISTLLIIDGQAIFFTTLLIAAALAVVMVSAGYLRHVPHAEEYYVLLVLSTLGGCVLVSADSLGALFLGLELLSVPLYAMVAYLRARRQSIEAALKYLVLGGAASALLLMGMAFLYAVTGSLKFGAVFDGLGDRPLWTVTGVALILASLAFKLALPPLHLWTPDVYQGASAPVAAFVATVSKGSVLVLLMRFLTPVLGSGGGRAAVSVLAIMAMGAGNLLALRQRNIKRLMAYSSIAHVGYLLVAVLAAGTYATMAVGFYLAVYFAATVAAFAVLAVLGDADDESQSIHAIGGLAWRNPLAGATMVMAMLSLAGLPVTGGFIGKIYVVLAGVDAKMWPLVLVLIGTSVVGLYYYLRVVVAVFAREVPRPAPTPAPIAAAGYVFMAAAIAFLLELGIYPQPLTRFIADLTSSAP